MFNIQKLQQELQAKFFGKEFLFFESTDSTNTSIKTIAEKGGEEGLVVIADEQVQGRGRLSRVWVSDPGKNLMFSLLLRPVYSTQLVQLLPFIFATAIAKTLRLVCHLNVETKWPNDILVNSKKICGMLLESSYQNDTVDYIIVGIGLNVNQRKFGDELEHSATSLIIETGREWDRESLLSHILLQCEREYEQFLLQDSVNVISLWKQYSTMFGKEITIHTNETSIPGIAIDVSPTGELLANVNNKLVKFNSADISIRY